MQHFYLNRQINIILRNFEWLRIRMILCFELSLQSKSVKRRKDNNVQ